jgi:hypothetical protein
MSIENKEYICEKCNFRTYYNNSYKKHLQSQLHLTGRRKERGDKVIPDRCPHCLYTTKVNTAMQTHIIRNHMTQEEQKEKLKFYCDHCKLGTLSKAQFDRHLQSTRHKNKLIYLGLVDNNNE